MKDKHKLDITSGRDTFSPPEEDEEVPLDELVIANLINAVNACKEVNLFKYQDELETEIARLTQVLEETRRPF